MMQIYAKDIEALVTCTIRGNEKIVFSGIQSAHEATESEITWIKPSFSKAEELINSSLAGGFICDESTFNLFRGTVAKKLFVIVEDPKFVFATLVKFVSSQFNRKKTMLIHPTALIDENCVLGANVEIGAYSVIGACIIGDNTIIHEHVRIYDPVTIGKNCLIREFCSIGGEGFGYFKNSDGKNEHIPHIGSVLIGDHVEIYPFCNVDRGTLGKTEIKQGTVIDHHVHVSHNSSVGENNIIAAGVIMAGGSQIKDNCFIGVNTLLKEKCIVGSNSLTGIGAVIIKDVEEGTVVVGNPAKFLKNN